MLFQLSCILSQKALANFLFFSKVFNVHTDDWRFRLVYQTDTYAPFRRGDLFPGERIWNWRLSECTDLYPKEKLQHVGILLLTLENLANLE